MSADVRMGRVGDVRTTATAEAVTLFTGHAADGRAAAPSEDGDTPDGRVGWDAPDVRACPRIWDAGRHCWLTVR